MGGEMNFPVVIYESKECLFISEALQSELKTRPASVLWMRQGLYGMIPKEVIQNELRIREDRKRLWDAEGNHGKWKDHWDIPLGFKWSETQDVPNGAKIIELMKERS
jgi:hypothetical protein